MSHDSFFRLHELIEDKNQKKDKLQKANRNVWASCRNSEVACWQQYVRRLCAPDKLVLIESSELSESASNIPAVRAKGNGRISRAASPWIVSHRFAGDVASHLFINLFNVPASLLPARFASLPVWPFPYLH